MRSCRDLLEASLNRVVPGHDKQRFLQAFCGTFIHMSPETEQYFSQHSGEGDQQMIFKSFFAMLAVNGDLLVPDFLERLAHEQSEEDLRLLPRFFALWQEVTPKVIHASDPLCDKEILTVWVMAIALGLKCLRCQAEPRYRTADQ